MTKNFIRVFFTLIIFLFLNSSLIYSQELSVPIPGVDCGNAEANDSARFCCKKVEFTPPSIPQAIKSIPIVGEWLENINQTMLKLQRATNVIPCVIGYPSNPNDPNCQCLKENQITPSPIEAVKQMCLSYLQGPEQGRCINECANKGGVWTAIGCVYGDLSKFIMEKFFGWGIGLAGIVALLCIIYSAFTLQTSQGNPEKIKKAQELLTSCIMGLMLIIFSVFILRLIGVDILRIPGFGK